MCISPFYLSTVCRNSRDQMQTMAAPSLADKNIVRSVRQPKLTVKAALCSPFNVLWYVLFMEHCILSFLSVCLFCTASDISITVVKYGSSIVQFSMAHILVVTFKIDFVETITNLVSIAIYYGVYIIFCCYVIQTSRTL